MPDPREQLVLFRWRPLAPLLTAVLGVIVGAGVASALPGGQIVAFLAVGLAAMPLLVVAKKEWLLAAVFVSVYLLDWMSRSLSIVPRQATWATEILVLVLLMRIAIEFLQRKRSRLSLPALAVGATAAASLLVGLAQGQDPAVMLLGVRKYLLFPALGLCLILGTWDDRLTARVWRWLLAVAVLQLPVSLYQLATVGGGDKASGTFGPGGTGLQALFLVCLVGTILFVGLNGDRRGAEWQRVAALVLLLVPTVIGSAIITLPLIAVTAAAVLVVRLKSQPRVLLGVAGVIVVVALALPWISSFLVSFGYPDPVKLLSDPLIALNYGDVTASALRPGRLDQLVLGWRAAYDGGLITAVFGHGLFAISPSYFNAMGGGELLVHNPMLALVTTSVARGIVETGLVGVVAWFVVCLDCVRRGVRLRRGRSEATAVLAHLAIMVGFVMSVAAFYDDAWNEPTTALLLWVVYALVLRTDNSETA